MNTYPYNMANIMPKDKPGFSGNSVKTGTFQQVVTFLPEIPEPARICGKITAVYKTDCGRKLLFPYHHITREQLDEFCHFVVIDDDWHLPVFDKPFTVDFGQIVENNLFASVIHK